MKAAILIFDGFDELDLTGPYEVLRIAGAQGEDITMDIVTREPQDTVTGIYGMTVVPDGVLDRSYELLIVSGGGWLTRNDAGAWGEIQRGALGEAIADWNSSEVTLAAVCTGAMILSGADLIGDRPVTTHHGAQQALRDEGGNVIDARVVDDGDLVTSGGVTAGIDLGLWLVERHYGSDRARAVAKAIAHDRPRDVYFGDRRAGDRTARAM